MQPLLVFRSRSRYRASNEGIEVSGCRSLASPPGRFYTLYGT